MAYRLVKNTVILKRVLNPIPVNKLLEHLMLANICTEKLIDVSPHNDTRLKTIIYKLNQRT